MNDFIEKQASKPNTICNFTVIVVKYKHKWEII